MPKYESDKLKFSHKKCGKNMYIQFWWLSWKLNAFYWEYLNLLLFDFVTREEKVRVEYINFINIRPDPDVAFELSLIAVNDSLHFLLHSRKPMVTSVIQRCTLQADPLYFAPTDSFCGLVLWRDQITRGKNCSSRSKTLRLEKQEETKLSPVPSNNYTECTGHKIVVFIYFIKY